MRTYIKSTWTEETDVTIRKNWTDSFENIFTMYNYQPRPTTATAVEKYYNIFPKEKHDVAAKYYHFFKEELAEQAYQMYYSGFNEVNFPNVYENKAKIFYDAFKEYINGSEQIDATTASVAYKLYDAGFGKRNGNAVIAKIFYDNFTTRPFTDGCAGSAYKLFDAGFTHNDASQANLFYIEFKNNNDEITKEEAEAAFKFKTNQVDASSAKKMFDIGTYDKSIFDAFMKEFKDIDNDNIQIIKLLFDAGFILNDVTGTKLICDEFATKKVAITNEIAKFIRDLYFADFKNPKQIFYMYSENEKLKNKFYTKKQTDDGFATIQMNVDANARVGIIERDYYQRFEANSLALKIEKNDNRIVMLSIALGLAIAIPTIRSFLHKP